MKKFTVALLYNLKKNAPHSEREDEPWDKWFELDSERDVQGYERALRDGGHQVIPIEGDISLEQKLARYKVDICFNTCEGHRGFSREAQVPAILDMLGVPYTGSGVMTLAIALDKAMTKRLLQYYHIPTPAFQVFHQAEQVLDPSIQFPVFIKPVYEGSGIGISAKSVCNTVEELRESVGRIVALYKQPALVEEFIDGREITVGLVGNLNHSPVALSTRTRKELVQEAALSASAAATPGNGGLNEKHQVETHPINRSGQPGEIKRLDGMQVFPPLEVDLDKTPVQEGRVYTSVIKGKMNDAPAYYCPTLLSPAQNDELIRCTVETFRALECQDLSRVDFRVRASDGKVFVLEINPLPGISEGVSDMVMAAEAAGVDYASLINGILDTALMRYRLLGDR